MKLLKNKIKSQMVEFIASMRDFDKKQLEASLVIVEELREVNLGIYNFFREEIRGRVKELQE